MYIDKTIVGRFVNLRSVTLDDAEFTLSIRQDPLLTKYMPALNISIDDQRKWIEIQRLTKGDYFFVVLSKNGERIGTISMYNLKDSHCNSGRIAIRGNSFEKIEAQLLALDFAFDELSVREVLSDTYFENKNTLRFGKGFGWVFQEPIQNEKGILVCYGTLSKSYYIINRKRIASMLYR